MSQQFEKESHLGDKSIRESNDSSSFVVLSKGRKIVPSKTDYSLRSSSVLNESNSKKPRLVTNNMMIQHQTSKGAYGQQVRVRQSVLAASGAAAMGQQKVNQSRANSYESNDISLIDVGNQSSQSLFKVERMADLQNQSMVIIPSQISQSPMITEAAAAANDFKSSVSNIGRVNESTQMDVLGFHSNIMMQTQSDVNISQQDLLLQDDSLIAQRKETKNAQLNLQKINLNKSLLKVDQQMGSSERRRMGLQLNSLAKSELMLTPRKKSREKQHRPSSVLRNSKIVTQVHDSSLEHIKIGQSTEEDFRGSVTQLLKKDNEKSDKLQKTIPKKEERKSAILASLRESIQQNLAGYEAPQSKNTRDFYASIRQQQTSLDSSEVASKKPNLIKGEKLIKQTERTQSNRYEKKFNFERGRYIQCIPNPKNENQRITVQIVERVLDENLKRNAAKIHQSIVHEVFGKDDVSSDGGGSRSNSSSVSKDQFSKSLSQTYERFKLVSPEDSEAQKDLGEGEDDSSESSSGDEDVVNIAVDLLKPSQSIRRSIPLSKKDSVITESYGGGEAKLYTDKSLFRDVDKLLGIQSKHYADIQKSLSNQLSQEARMDCEEFAVVAFWDLTEDDVLQCNRFFIVPNPTKRIIQQVQETQLEQVLFVSEHTKEVFFFWRGYELYDDQDNSGREKQVFVSFLELTLSQRQIDSIGEIRHIHSHCYETYPIAEGSPLNNYLKRIHMLPISQQSQVPNPTVVNIPQASSTIESAVDDSLGHNDEQAQVDSSSKKPRAIVFTSYYLDMSKEKGDERHAIKTWYPTIHFYDFANQKTIWQVYGAEQFIRLANQKVQVLSNTVWSKLTQHEFDDLENSRHKDFDSEVWKIRFGVTPSESHSDDQIKKRPPPLPKVKSYKLTFGKNKNLEFTEPYKVVSAHSHNKGKRVTLLYQSLGSFTFELQEARSLTQASLWHGIYKGKSFNCQLKFTLASRDATNEHFQQLNESINSSLHEDTDTKRLIIVSGDGTVDESETKISISAKMMPIDESSFWTGVITKGDAVRPFEVIGLSFDHDAKRIMAKWVDDDDVAHELTGKIGKRHKSGVDIEFTIKTGQNAFQHFKAQVDSLHSEIRGKCSGVGDSESVPEKLPQDFFLHLASDIPADLTFKTVKTEYKERIMVNYLSKRISKVEGSETEIEIRAVEAVDQAVLTYSILERDVSFLEIKDQTYIQAKLRGLEDDEDINSNGKGFTETSAILYNVSSVQQRKDQKRQELAREPKERINFRFYLNRSFLRTQQRSDVQLWHVFTSIVTADGKVYGSVIFEENGSDEIQLNMFSASVEEVSVSEDGSNDSERDSCKLQYYQEPVQQSWIVDYPLLAYKTFTPRNKEIAIIHLAQDMPQRIIHLGQWEFVCFVNHTQMVEQKCFKKQKETNCDIMFLVRRKNVIRLMSFKSNPWLHYLHQASDERDTDVVKQSIYIFSGDIGVIPTQDFEGTKIVQDVKNHKKYKQRFNNDKVQTCQLITKQLGSYDQFMLIIQFNDSIVQASLNRNFFKLICQPETMVRRHLIRGYNEKIFFAETSSGVDKIYQAEFHPTKNDEITKKEIYQLTGGWLVALEPDGECIENDTDKHVTQSFFVMDDQQKIYLLKNEDNVRFTVKKTINLASHNILKEVNALRENDWAHVHISERTLTLEGTIYNLNTNLSVEIDFPKMYFGQKTSSGGNYGGSSYGGGSSMHDSRTSFSSEFSLEDSEDSDIEIKRENTENWQVTQVQGMSMTTNMILIGQKDQREFCFVMKPAPGSRKISIVGFQQLHEIEQMLFVSNNHVLIKLRGGKAVTLLSNGSIVHQEQRVQNLLEKAQKVIGESQVFRGRKTVLLEDAFQEANEHGEEVKKFRHITVSFSSAGLATVSGIFKDYQQQTKEFLKARVKQLQEASYNRQQSVSMAYSNNSMDNIDFPADLANNFAKKKLCKFAKEFFITEKGEVIKMAALITPNPVVEAQLKDQKQKQLMVRKKKKVKSGTTAKVYISIFKIQNSVNVNKGSMLLEQGAGLSAFTVIAIHCLEDDEQEQFVKNTQYCVVGNYLCYRRRNEQVIWITKLKDKVDDLLQNSKREKQDNQLAFKEYTAVAHSIDKMTRKIQIEHIQLTEVPKAYFTTIKARKTDNTLEFYDNLLQVTIGTNGMIFDLDSTPVKEVASIESIDQLYKPDQFANTGFIMSTSHNETKEDLLNYLERKQIFTNEYSNLLFQKRQSRLRKENEEFAIYSTDFKISGMLYRTFADIDLVELQQIQNSINTRTKINYIDPETILANFEGHTIFSVFFDRIEVFEQIYNQLAVLEFLPEDDINGFSVENSYLRRLFRVLTLPTADLLHYKKKPLSRQNVQKQAEKKRKRQMKLCLNFCCQELLGREKETSRNDTGFKSLPKKSMHFKSARFRETLMKIIEMCEESAISDFVENLDDINILFKSMSPTVFTLLQNAYKITRFTKAIKNADWRLGTDSEVIGQATSITMQKDMIKKIKQNQKTMFSDAVDVQNRQVEAQMLPIDWVFADCPGKKNVGFSDFVVKLAQAPHESLFDTDFVTTLVSHFWSRYYYSVILKCFIPFVVYLISTLLYISNFAVHGVDLPEDDYTPTFESCLRYLTLGLSIYFFYYEIRCIIRDRFGYFLDIFNYIDLLSFTLNFYLIFKAVQGEYPYHDRKDYIRSFSALACILMWFKSFYWLRLFGNTSFFIRMIQETLYDIRYFLILFVFILMTFGNAMMILSTDREDPLYRNYIGIEFINVMLSQYELSLGNPDTENFQDPSDGGDRVAWIVFVGATMITQIMFLNMLIAIMGATFERVTATRDSLALLEKIRILADYVFVVPRESEAKGTMDRFLFVIKPSDDVHNQKRHHVSAKHLQSPTQGHSSTVVERQAQPRGGV